MQSVIFCLYNIDLVPQCPDDIQMKDNEAYATPLDISMQGNEANESLARPPSAMDTPTIEIIL